MLHEVEEIFNVKPTERRNTQKEVSRTYLQESIDPVYGNCRLNVVRGSFAFILATSSGFLKGPCGFFGRLIWSIWGTVCDNLSRFLAETYLVRVHLMVYRKLEDAI